MTMYNLSGDQSEPNAAFWSRKKYLSTVTIEEIRKKFTPFPYAPDEEQTAKPFLEELRDKADNTAFFASNPLDLAPLSIYLSDSLFTGMPPVGAVVSRRPAGPLIINGMELATLFESETPGLWHRHVLNVLLDQPNPASGLKWRETLSPPRQALYWHILDTAIDSALAAVWHFKWLATSTRNPDDFRYRHRPSEAGLTPILFDFECEWDGDGNIYRTEPRPERTCVSQSQTVPYTPGTPRHPAYGSGHSTYSQAASSVMAFILSEENGFPPLFQEGWQPLADNIGQARFWGGVHWPSDHTFGQALGQAVAECIIKQLKTAGVPTPSLTECRPPAISDLVDRENAFIGSPPAPAGQFRIDPQSIQGV